MNFKHLFTLSFCLFSFSLSAQNQFSRETVLEDLEYMKNALIEAHYNIYAYTSESEFNKKYEEIRASINKDSLTLLEVTSLYQQVIAKVKNGHTSIDFPVQPYIEYGQNGGTVFPLEIAFENEKCYVRKNWSLNEDIQVGSELVSINGLSMKEILGKIYKQISAERSYFKNVKIELFSFPRYYWQVFGQEEEYNVEIRSNGQLNKYNLQPAKLIEGYEMKRDEVINAKLNLKFYEQVAYLNPGSFSGDEVKYRHFIDSAFTEIKKKGNKNLIVDLRNNGGGDDSFSDYLVSYFANKPFKWNSSFTLKSSAFLKEHTRKNKDTTEVYWRNILSHEDGEIYAYEFEEYKPQPDQKRFQGEVYVLVNRQSHSQAAVTAAQIQDYGFATIVGEETGDYPTLYASIFQFPLPNTQINVNVSKGYIVRVNGSEKQQGVIPDIIIKDHLLDEKDEILNGLFEIVTKE